MRWAPVFAATVNATVPLPLPVAPDVIVNHGLLVLLTAVHAQPAVVVTVTVVPAPLARRSTDSAARSCRRRVRRLGHREGLPGNRERAGALGACVRGDCERDRPAAVAACT